MPVKVDIVPPPPANSKQPGVTRSLLYNGSKFKGHQKSKGNSYEVEVVLQVRIPLSLSLSLVILRLIIQQQYFYIPSFLHPIRLIIYSTRKTNKESMKNPNSVFRFLLPHNYLS